MGIKEVSFGAALAVATSIRGRVIGTLRWKCLDHVIVLNEASLYRHVKSFLAYYHASRTHLSLAKDAPEPRPVHPPELGTVIAIPQLAGSDRYERLNVRVPPKLRTQKELCRFSLPYTMLFDRQSQRRLSYMLL